MGKARVSIVTPSFNQARFIRRTIESVLSQEGDHELDYRVVDGGSTDGTIDVLREFGQRLIWTTEPDHGQIDAINKGLRAATGEIVGWLNSDDVLLPGALARVVDAFRRNPGTEWVHGRCEIIDESGAPIRRWVSWYKHVRASRHSFERLLVDNYISQMTTFWRRSAQQAVGLLDPDFPLAFDYEFWLRLAKRGPPVYIPQPIACFRWYDSSKSGAGFEEQFRENTAVAMRHATRASRWLYWRKRARNAVYAGLYRAMASLRTKPTSAG